MKPNSEVAIRPGASSGRITLPKACMRVQPSTIADSSSSLGTAATKPRSVEEGEGQDHHHVEEGQRDAGC